MLDVVLFYQVQWHLKGGISINILHRSHVTVNKWYKKKKWCRNNFVSTFPKHHFWCFFLPLISCNIKPECAYLMLINECLLHYSSVIYFTLTVFCISVYDTEHIPYILIFYSVYKYQHSLKLIKLTFTVHLSSICTILDDAAILHKVKF